VLAGGRLDLRMRQDLRCGGRTWEGLVGTLDIVLALRCVIRFATVLRPVGYERALTGLLAVLDCLLCEFGGLTAAVSSANLDVEDW